MLTSYFIESLFSLVYILKIICRKRNLNSKKTESKNFKKFESKNLKKFEYTGKSKFHFNPQPWN